MELGIFLTRKVIAVYTAVAYRYNKKCVPKKQQVSPIFWYSLPIFISLHGYFAGKTYTFLKAWHMYNSVKANIGLNCHLCVVNNFYTHVATKHVL